MTVPHPASVSTEVPRECASHTPDAKRPAPLTARAMLSEKKRRANGEEVAICGTTDTANRRSLANIGPR